MASRTDREGVPVFEKFHRKCGEGVVLSEGRRVASNSRVRNLVRSQSAFASIVALLVDTFPIAFSNDPIPRGVQFSVKVLQESKDYVSPLIQTPCSLQCMPCLDSAHTTAVNSQLVSCRLV